MNKKEVKEIIKIAEHWIDSDMVKATTTYKRWQHDKGSFAYGWIMGVQALIETLYESIENKK